jgi:hypothetical protein
VDRDEISAAHDPLQPSDIPALSIEKQFPGRLY